MAGNTNQPNADGTGAKGPKYTINIDGTNYPWSSETITASDIRRLAGWGNDQTVEEINLKTNTKTVLRDSDSVELKPGHGFAKKIEFVSETVTPPRSHAC